MAIFNPQTPAKKEAASFTPDPPPFRETPANADAMPAVGAPAVAPASRTEPQAKESLIASDLTIEGKIEGAGHVRIAGRFKGDVNVQGDLTLDAGAKLTGSVRARKVVIAGELEGNVDGAQRVELQQGGVLVGDVKAGTLTVAAGARMRGQVDFGWEDKAKSGGNAESNAAAA
ncbi:MAG: polymer-forming cytoskeletal protein [Lysobacter sp.]|nr:polymer-forming cytoskeletal protein [Lysobacter sp.]